MIVTLIRIAFRNIVKNHQRSQITVLAIAIGFATLTLVNGYTSDAFTELGYSAAVQEGLGHLTVYKRGWLEEGTLYPKKHLLTKDDVVRIREMAKEVPSVRLVSPKLNVSGLVSNGKFSSIFTAEGTIPDDFNTLIHSHGSPAGDSHVDYDMDPASPAGIQMAEGLAKLMGFDAGAHGLLSAVPLDGKTNAVHVEVNRTFHTGIPKTNDTFIRIPLSMARGLLDTEGADRVMILLDTPARAASARAVLVERFRAAGLEVDIKTWQEQSAFYETAKGALAMLLAFVGAIVLVIVVTSVIHTMAASVVERTREIGTLRVLGLKRRATAWLFAIEGACLGLLGSGLGAILHSVAWIGIGAAHIHYVPLGNSESVTLGVEYVPGFVVELAVAILLFSLLAALVPARQAAKRNVVVSLRFI